MAKTDFKTIDEYQKVLMRTRVTPEKNLNEIFLVQTT